MRMNVRQREIVLRTGVVLSACVALSAMTSGLLLAIHLGSVEHTTDHDAGSCSLCQHLLVMPKGLMLAPSAGLVHDTCACTVAPELVAHVQVLRLHASQPRGPPRTGERRPV